MAVSALFFSILAWNIPQVNASVSILNADHH